MISFLVMQRIEKNSDALMALHKLGEASRRVILPALSKDTLLALDECTKTLY